MNAPNPEQSTERTTTPALTDRQLALVQRYFDLCRHNLSVTRDPLWVALVIAGDRPAAMVASPSRTPNATPISSEYEHALDELLDRLDLSYRYSEPSGYLITPDSDRFALLPDPDVNGDSYHRQLGHFLGYPDTAIEAFLENTTGKVSTMRVDVRRENLTTEQLAYTAFVPWVGDRTHSGYERTIAVGKQNAQRLETLTEAWESPALSELIGRAYGIQRSRLDFGSSNPEWHYRLLIWIDDWLTPSLPEE